MSSCHLCEKIFSRRDAVLRHIKQKHQTDTLSSPLLPEQSILQHQILPPPKLPQTQFSPQPQMPTPSPPQLLPPPPTHQRVTDEFRFKHPFTCIVSGPTSCGKTTFIKDLLHRNDRFIKPRLQRIVWLYKRWQPLYEDILKSVVPRVEFVQGLPDNIESDDFIRPNMRNLVVIDDLATACSKDSRVSDLFTEGSHHRNLSVIVLNQNLYHSKNPTERRNCQYLVLFKNPIDKQAMMTLARQMYPGKTDYFLKKFDEATSEPYHYLLVDLRADTKEVNRFQTNVLGIKDGSRTILHQYTSSLQRDNMYRANNCLKPVGISDDNSSLMACEINNMTACDDCGLLFENIHDLQRHVKTWCPEIMPPPAKRMKLDETGDNHTESSQHTLVPDAELPIYQQIMQQSQDDNQQIWDKRVSKYMRDGMTEDEAADKANQKMEDADMALFMKKYSRLLLDILQLTKGPVHNKIVNTIRDNVQQKYSEQKAVKLALKQFQEDIKKILPDNESDSESDTESEEDGDGEVDVL